MVTISALFVWNSVLVEVLKHQDIVDLTMNASNAKYYQLQGGASSSLCNMISSGREAIEYSL